MEQLLLQLRRGESVFQHDLRGDALLFAQQSQEQVFSGDVRMLQPLGLLSPIRQHALALRAQREVHGNGNLLAARRLLLNLRPNRLNFVPRY
jgi:hypothetical protein